MTWLLWLVVILLFLYMVPSFMPYEVKRMWVGKLLDWYLRIKRHNEELDRKIAEDEEKIKSLLNK